MLGPGRRAVVWVQGCPFTCAGCVSPEWIPDRAARLVPPGELAEEILADETVSGLTFSGGEPMAQADGLADLAEQCRQRRDLTLVCFTGYRLERLRGPSAPPGAARLLAQADVLIDGLYVAARDDGRGLRGSDNQRVHHLTGRLAGTGYDFEHRARTAYVRLAGPDLFIVGVPPQGLVAAVERAIVPVGGPTVTEGHQR
ncbi:4Fe-4S single cluster domain-containing protein [Dactylosporangium darangshiense]|uniref:4Fe-4S single cluster domain-containing protein n=1 Tax=Dactylosporangium darangshiense TaxID=579108 RepID=UPI0031EA21B2